LGGALEGHLKSYLLILAVTSTSMNIPSGAKSSTKPISVCETPSLFFVLQKVFERFRLLTSLEKIGGVSHFVPGGPGVGERAVDFSIEVAYKYPD